MMTLRHSVDFIGELDFGMIFYLLKLRQGHTYHLVHDLGEKWEGDKWKDGNDGVESRELWRGPEKLKARG